MSLLAEHGDENRDERKRSVPPPAVYPQLVLGLSGHGNVNANGYGYGHGNGNSNGNPNYRYSIELASPVKLSPISASGVFSRYNVFSPLNNSNSNSKDSKSTSKNGRTLARIVGEKDGGDSSSNENDRGNDSYSMPRTASAASSNTVEEIDNGHEDKEGSAPFKKFKNPFASSVVSSFGTLELSGVTEGSFTTISISTIDTAKENDGKCITKTKTTVRANDAQDEQIDRILRIAKKMMGDELIEDLIASSTPTVRAQTHRQRRFGFPAVATYSSGDSDNKIESIGEFVETVIEKELTFCSWACELTIRQDFAGLDDVSLDGASLDGASFDGGLYGFSLGSFDTGVSTGTVVRYLHRHDPRQQHDRQHQLSLVDVLKPRKRDWFLRLFHWHHPHHLRMQV